jgi:hypothetical protein
MTIEETERPLFKTPLEPVSAFESRDFVNEAQTFADFLDEPLTRIELTSMIPIREHFMYTFIVDRIEENDEGEPVLLSFKSDNITFVNLQEAIRDMTPEELDEYSVLIENVGIIRDYINCAFNWPRPFNTQIA